MDTKKKDALIQENWELIKIYAKKNSISNKIRSYNHFRLCTLRYILLRTMCYDLLYVVSMKYEEHSHKSISILSLRASNDRRKPSLPDDSTKNLNILEKSHFMIPGKKIGTKKAQISPSLFYNS